MGTRRLLSLVIYDEYMCWFWWTHYQRISAFFKHLKRGQGNMLVKGRYSSYWNGNLKQPRQTRFLFVVFGPHMIGSSARISWPGWMSLAATMNLPYVSFLSIFHKPVAARSHPANKASCSQSPAVMCSSTGWAAEERTGARLYLRVTCSAMN